VVGVSGAGARWRGSDGIGEAAPKYPHLVAPSFFRLVQTSSVAECAFSGAMGGVPDYY